MCACLGVCSGFTYEVVIVDDGSTDKTYEVAVAYTKKYGDDLIRVCKLFKNCGKGGAVRKVRSQGFASPSPPPSISTVSNLRLLLPSAHAP